MDRAQEQDPVDVLTVLLEEVKIYNCIYILFIVEWTDLMQRTLMCGILYR